MMSLVRAARFWLTLIYATSVAWAGPAATPEYYRDVRPILERRCVTCHRANEIGPMPLTSFPETRPWAKAIKEAVLRRAMPPWSADPSVGVSFRNDRSLQTAEIGTLAAWADSGAKEGVQTAEREVLAKDAPVFSGAPDRVIRIPGYQVPASGTLQYTFLVAPLHLDHDTWIAGAEWSIGHPGVVHHINAYVRPPGSSYVSNVPAGKLYVASKEERAVRRGGEVETDRRELLVGYEPGYRAEQWGKDRAKLIRAGSDVVLEMHYTPNGKPVEDFSELRIYFAKKPPLERVVTILPADSKLAIPPGDPNYRSIARATFTEPVTMVSLQPHMHVRGKAYEISATYPDGRKEVLLRVPRYDFHWQTTYFLDRPLAIPAGTVIEGDAWYDNSPNNPNNPDPSKTVYWGDQSWDEMNIGFLEVAFDAKHSPEVAVLSDTTKPGSSR
jgi:hypothetical protein